MGGGEKFDGSDEVFQGDRFRGMFGKARLGTAFQVFLHAVAAHDDPGNGAEPEDGFHHLAAAAVRQAEVADDDVKLPVRGAGDGLFHT